jgi:hypothetical protein
MVEKFDGLLFGDEAHLARIDDGALGRRRTFAIVVIGVEFTDQLIEFEGGLPNIAE